MFAYLDKEGVEEIEKTLSFGLCHLITIVHALFVLNDSFPFGRA